ncbi:MAG: 4-alpha-glucanotransferase [Thermodesulfobacteriota bacterium]|nr:4-alpha-glucanotransferase [Thermodesulfobacteriota bacterium]
MSQLSYRDIIDRLAVSCGIEPEYVDNWGRSQRTSLHTKRAILTSMGLEVDSEVQARAAYHGREKARQTRMVEPTIVARLSSLPKGLVFQIPVEDPGSSVGSACQDLEGTLDVSDEQAMVQRFHFTSKDLLVCEKTERVWQRWELPFPRLKALGYYRFHLSVRCKEKRWSESVFVAICPDKAYVPPALQGKGRAAGIALSLYGIRSHRNWGVGDFGDLKEMVRWVAEDLHGSVIGLNPLHALYNRRPYNTSPYLPMSRFYRNPIYLDIPAMEDYEASPEAQELVRAWEAQGVLAELRASDTVQYERVIGLKLKVLRRVFKAFLKNHWLETSGQSKRQKGLRRYIEKEGPLLENFATYCALDTNMRAKDPEMWTWSAWPPQYRRPDSEAVRGFQKEEQHEILFHKYVQWQVEKQLKEVQDYAETLGTCVGLYHDLALAVDRFSADCWAYQDLFLPGLRVGAPPDAFSLNGQDWGFPPMNMEKLRETGYGLFIKELQKNCAFAGSLRIDHVMRFFHLYCIPEGSPPCKGAYLSQPFEDLLNIVTLESVRNQVMIVGEDLGTVPDHTRHTLRKRDIFSYRLLYFEKDDQGSPIWPNDYPELAVVTVGTHDLPTLAGFWTHRDIKVRKEAGLFQEEGAEAPLAVEREADKERIVALFQDLGLLAQEKGAEVYAEVSGELHNAVVGFLALTSAKLFILSQEDLFKVRDQQNLPGTTVEYPNWSMKARYTVEELGSEPRATAFGAMFRSWVDRTGRYRAAA